MINWSDIKTKKDFSDYIGVSLDALDFILENKINRKLYYDFCIPKKNGKSRAISCPNDNLKLIQNKIYLKLLEYREYLIDNCIISNKVSHGFELKKSIITNAKLHKHKKYIINIDLEDFFTSFHFGRVCGFFEKNRNFMLPHNIAVIISKLVCKDGVLPQGAPTSPIITNFICGIFDFRVLKLAKKYKLDYSRYADDLTFSTNNSFVKEKYDEFLNDISREVLCAGFKINAYKTSFAYHTSKQVVTGLVVNDKVNVDNAYYKKVRAMAHSLYKTGKFFIDGSEGTINQLEGKFSYIHHINKKSFEIQRNNICAKKKNSEFDRRDKSFIEFLFYKNFYCNKKPLIITEGKTDVLYLKAALMNLYKEYPLLVENKGSHFKYNISFFKKSSIINEMFDFNKDGGHTFKRVYDLYCDKRSKNDHEKYGLLNKFNILTNKSFTMPVFLLFDNELVNKDKPLYNFLSSNNIKDKSNNLKNNLFYKVFENGNLYIITNPLVNGKDECEIEELFDESTLSHNFSGKTLSLNKDFDTSIHVGKNIFANYIYYNYKKIDFKNFRYIFDIMNDIIDEYI